MILIKRPLLIILDEYLLKERQTCFSNTDTTEEFILLSYHLSVIKLIKKVFKESIFESSWNIPQKVGD